MTSASRVYPTLPIDVVLPDIVTALSRHNALVLQAEPGAGKTTRVPLALLDAGVLDDGALLMLEPRRLAARGSAERMATLLDESVGHRVGYQVRYDSRVSVGTRIVSMTDGVFLNRITEDPLLEGVSCVVIDEFHERSVNVDLALGFVKEVLDARDDLKLIVMSATMDTGAVSRYLGSCPVVQSEGRMFPLEINYYEKEMSRRLDTHMSGAVDYALKKYPEGDVLVFLPGAPEINRVAQLLAAAREDVEIVPLYGSLPPAQQQRIYYSGGKRRVVLATNIAETSLTIPGVKVVVDSGLVKKMKWEPGGIGRLETVKASLHSITQRAGRAGRVESGQVLRVWQKSREKERLPEDVPEIRTADPLTYLLPLLKFAPADPGAFDLLSRPSAQTLEEGRRILVLFGALEADSWRLTALGKQMVRLPLHPRLSAVLVAAARQGRLKEGARLVAIMASKDIVRSDVSIEAMVHPCDVRWRAELLSQYQQKTGASAGMLHRHAVSEVLALERQLLQLMGQWNSDDMAIDTDINCLVAGFPDRVCLKDQKNAVNGKLSDGSRVTLGRWTGVKEEALLVVLDATSGKQGSHQTKLVRLGSRVTQADLQALFSDCFKPVHTAVYDSATESIKGTQYTSFLQLAFNRSSAAVDDDGLIADALFGVAVKQWEGVFAPDKQSSLFIARLHFAVAHSTKVVLPDVSTAGLQVVLKEYCFGKRSLKAVKNINWKEQLSGRMDYQQKKYLQTAFPSHYTLSTGTTVAIDYAQGLEPGKTPGIAAKLQEFFGMAATPVVGHNIPLTVTLLSPAGRPLQVTRDLTSFWTNGYQQVKKEMRSRYPKHPWPDDPLQALPTGKTKRQMNR